MDTVSLASSVVECDVCSNIFSEQIPPRILPCSHTFCGSCIDRIITAEIKICPSCKKEFIAPSAQHLAINRIALDVVKLLPAMDTKPKTFSRGRKRSFDDLTKEFPNKLSKGSIQETETRVLESLKILDEMKEVFAATEALNEMKDGVMNTKKEIEKFQENLTDIELFIEQILHKIKESGIKATSVAETDFTLTESLPDSQRKVMRIKEHVQENQRERDDITKKILKMKRRLGNVAEEIQKAKTFAVRMLEGKRRVAQIKILSNNQIHLSHFTEGNVPPKSLVIKHEALMNTSSRRAFLDLAIKGTFFTRIVIKLMDEGNLALNFLHLCAGDLGPCFANSQFSGVGNKGYAGECVVMGGYSSSGDSIARSGLKVDWKKEEQREIYKSRPYKAGDVRGVFSEENASKFRIFTRDTPHLIKNNCFGIVEEGLEALRGAISQYPDFKAVRVINCGLMFSL